MFLPILPQISTCTNLGDEIQCVMLLVSLLKKGHFRTKFQTALGRNLRKFPTDFGRNDVFGRNSDRKGVVRKDRVAISHGFVCGILD